MIILTCVPHVLLRPVVIHQHKQEPMLRVLSMLAPADTASTWPLSQLVVTLSTGTAFVINDYSQWVSPLSATLVGPLYLRMTATCSAYCTFHCSVEGRCPQPCFTRYVVGDNDICSPEHAAETKHQVSHLMSRTCGWYMILILNIPLR